MFGMILANQNSHNSEEGQSISAEQPYHTQTQEESLRRKDTGKSTTSGSGPRGKKVKEQNCQDNQGGDQESQRRERNKQAAKRSRAKNKARLQRLEVLEVELQRELEAKREELAQAKRQLEIELSKNTLPNNLKAGKQMTYSRLEDLISMEDCVDEDEVNLLLDTLKQRVGASCKERQTCINYYFKQWIHLCYPALHRFLMLTATEGTQYFGEQPVEWARSIDESLKLTPQQRLQISSRRQNFIDFKEILTKYIDDIHIAKSSLQTEGEALETSLQEVRTFLTPRQCAQVVLFCEKNKYKKQMHLWSQANLRKFETIDSVELEEPSKRKLMRTEDGRQVTRVNQKL